jgi:hypothetical protein
MIVAPMLIRSPMNTRPLIQARPLFAIGLSVLPWLIYDFPPSTVVHFRGLTGAVIGQTDMASLISSMNRLLLPERESPGLDMNTEINIDNNLIWFIYRKSACFT